MKNPKPGIDYDPSSIDSIVYYARKLEGKSLRKELDIPEDESLARKGKGGFGETVEYRYFGYEPNSRSEPDFAKAGLELKVTPLKKILKGELVPKERLVITMINYMTVVSEQFKTSTLYQKIYQMLLMHYLHDEDADPLDYEFKLVYLWRVPPEDYPTIKADWEAIVGKIRAGFAHELSGGDTNYLEATTKATNSSRTRPQPFSGIPAKPRAFALKSSYMRIVTKRKLEARAIPRDDTQKEMGLEELVKSRFAPYITMTSIELSELFSLNTKAKGFYASVTKKILGLGEKEKVLEFEKAGLKVKTIRLKANGVPKEDISFKTMDYCKVVSQDWEESDFYEDLSSRFLFVIYRISIENGEEVTRLEGIKFWTMPIGDLDSEAKRCFEDTVERIVNGQACDLPKKSENRCVHVRPHGRNKADTCTTPQGAQVTKKCFWLNAGYIARELKLIDE